MLNKVIVSGDIAIIYIDSPKYGIKKVFIDLEDLERVKCLGTIGYVNMGQRDAVIHSKRKKGKTTNIYLHNFLLNTPKGFVVDHINHNTLDNRKCNLRICTHQENMWNKRGFKNSSSRFKGVTWCKRSKKWRSQIFYQKNGKRTGKTIGYFLIEEDAAKAYDLEAMKIQGEFANLNFKGSGC